MVQMGAGICVLIAFAVDPWAKLHWGWDRFGEMTCRTEWSWGHTVSSDGSQSWGPR